MRTEPSRALNPPPTVSGHLLWGTARDFQADPLGEMRRLHATHGDAMRVHFFGPFYGYLFNHPDHYQHILQENNRNYHKIPAPSFVLLQPAVGNGLLTSDGDFWLRQRRLAQPAFHRRRIAEFADMMVAAGERAVERWRTLPPGGTLHFAEEMHRLTLEIVGKTLLDIDLIGESERIGAAVNVMSKEVSALSVAPLALLTIRIPFWPSTRRLTRAVQTLDAIVAEIIAERRANPGDRGDLLSMFMAARDEETGATMDDRQLRDELNTMILAGHETTAVLLSWTWYLLTEHPEVLAQVRAEVDSVLAGRAPTFDDVPRLTYTMMVLQEVLRLYPPAYVTARYGVAADVVGGYDIPAGSIISMPTFLLHRDPRWWDNPDRFDPLRFSPEQVKARPRFTYLPFGGGPRQCIGNQFALTEALLLTALFAQRVELTRCESGPLALDPQITLRPAGSLPMAVRPIATAVAA